MNNTCNEGRSYLAEGKPREKSKVPTASEPVLYYAQLRSGHHSAPSNPALCRSLANLGCSYSSHFTSEADPEAEAEQSLELWKQRRVWNFGGRKWDIP